MAGSGAKSTFFERTDVLMDLVGDGELTGRTEVNQVYAWNQHEGRWLDFMGKHGPKNIDSHPRGGGPPPSKFLEDPVKERAEEFVGRLADAVLDGRLVQEMASIQEDLVGEVFDRAPRFNDILRDSGQPSVFDDGVEVYRREANEPRREGGEPFAGVPEGYYGEDD